MARFSTSRELLFFLTHPTLWFRQPLSQKSLHADPFVVFEQWYNQAKKSLSGEFPNAMCLSTTGTDDYPEGRIVLLKEWSKEGFVFYSNTQSQKGAALSAHPKASITFYWSVSQRQVRIKGDVEFVDNSTADQYFSSRPRRSQIGAWASEQSTTLHSRKELEDKVIEYEEKFAQQPIPRPDYWTGYRIKPIEIEFWQLRLNRLHDRILYKKTSKESWTKSRLSP